MTKINPINTINRIDITKEKPQTLLSHLSIEQLIEEAVACSASDVHIEPFGDFFRIRYRRDGLLCEAAILPNAVALRSITRLKVLAKLDIAERRLPQDGHFQLNHKDIRISSCPTLLGEKIVLRILNTYHKNNKNFLEFSTLGLTKGQEKCLIKKISQPHGMILVTGPTGSGKTVTLYSALNYLNTIDKNISTVEDPVEIELNGVNQINIHPKIGLDFASILRTLLRQDPDILMIGEIRDIETAQLAIQAAQTGHLVLSTLHTNNTIEAVTRLQSLGISSNNIASALSLIIAQRLLRKLCPHCKRQTQDAVFCAANQSNCEYCLNGYQGRIAIYEFLPISEKIMESLFTKTPLITIRQELKKEGFLTLYEMGLEKVKEGLTSMAELNRMVIAD